jgi:membrane protease subunit HflC
MIDMIRRRPLFMGFAALFLLFTVLSSFVIVPETKQAVIVRFGKPARILGATEAGINWRLPFAENIQWIDKRVLDVDMDRQQVLSTDQLRLEVDAFARYRITDPLRMYIKAGSTIR